MRAANQRIAGANGRNCRALLYRLREGRQRGEQAGGKQEFGFHGFPPGMVKRFRMMLA
jgi:hypothetical protein